MKKTKMLLYESIPSWYRLGFRRSDATIVIGIHETCFAGLKDIPSTAPAVQHLEKLRGLRGDLLTSGFCGSFGADTFGWNGALVKQPRRSGDPFVEYCARIPKVWYTTHEVCQYCSGTKEDHGRECRACRTTNGKGRECDFTTAHAIQASLVILLWALDCPPEVDVESDRWQALTVRCHADAGPSGSGLWGHMSPDTIDYLKGLSQSKQDELMHEVVESIMIAHGTMMDKPSDPHAFFGRLDSRGIHVSCPGNATGIDGAFDRVGHKRCGARFDPHNVDCPIQGLSLLAGVAKLSELTQFWLKREIARPVEK